MTNPKPTAEMKEKIIRKQEELIKLLQSTPKSNEDAYSLPFRIQTLEREIAKLKEQPDDFLASEVDRVIEERMGKPIGLDEADVLVKQTDYIIEATHQDINPINMSDASAFFIGGYNEALRRIKGKQ